MSKLINRLAELREAKGWTQTFVAAERGVSERTVSRWETGVTPIPSDQVPALAEMFEVTPEWLMGWDRIPATPKAAA
jgi:repressor LexA